MIFCWPEPDPVSGGVMCMRFVLLRFDIDSKPTVLLLHDTLDCGIFRPRRMVLTYCGAVVFVCLQRGVGFLPYDSG